MEIKICRWKKCSANFSEYIVKRLKADIKRLNLENIEIKETLCMWMCSKWPNVIIDDTEIINYAEPAKVSDRMINWPKKKKNKK